MGLSRKNDFYRHDLEVGIVPDTDALIYALNANDLIETKHCLTCEFMLKVTMILGFLAGITLGYTLFF